MTDIRQSTQYANYLSKIGWRVERIAEINYFIKKFLVLGSILKLQRPDEIRISKIRELAKRYRVFQIIIEPKTEMDAKFLTSVGFKLSKSPYLPTKTLQLDLTKSEKSLLAALKKDARKTLQKIGKIKVKKASGMEEFRETWKKAVGLKRYVPPTGQLTALKKAFKKNALFLLDSGSTSGAIFLVADNMGYYWQAFTGKEGRNSMTQYKIVWEGIRWSKKRGARVFDFEGIYDERFPNKSWLGFSHFKKSFGGYEIDYPGCFVKNLLPFGR